MNENFNQVNNNQNSSFTDYQNDAQVNNNVPYQQPQTNNQANNYVPYQQPQANNQANNYVPYQQPQTNNQANNYVPYQQPPMGPMGESSYNNDFVYNDEGGKAFNGGKNNAIKYILIGIGLLIIILIIFLLLKFCGNGRMGKLTGFTADNQIITYINEKKDINFNATGTGNLDSVEFAFEIEDDSIVEVDNDTQIGSSVENELKGLTEGETTLNVVAKLGEKEFNKDIDIIVCNRFEVSEITDDTISVAIGKTTQISLDLGENAKCYASISYNINDTSVASIDDNFNITGIKSGTTTLIISDGQNQKEFTIKVIDPNKTVIAKSISVKPKSKTLSIGKTVKLKATISPSNTSNKRVDWSSKDPSVARVSKSGTVTAVSVGKTTITAMTLDGSNKKATVTIVVTIPTPPKPIPTDIKVTGIRFTSSSYTVQENMNYNAGVIFTPTNATNKTISKCQSSDTTIAKVSLYNGNICRVTGIKAGKVTIAAYSTDGNIRAAAIVNVPAKEVAQYSVNVTVNNGGSVTSANPLQVKKGGSGTFNVVAPSGYKLSGVTCDNASGSISGNTLTVSNVIGNTKCTVTTTKTPTPTATYYTIKMSVKNGTASPYSKLIKKGGTYTFTITPDPGYRLATADCGGYAKVSYNDNKLTVSNVTGNYTCKVEADPDPSKVTKIVYLCRGTYTVTTQTCQLSYKCVCRNGYNTTTKTKMACEEACEKRNDILSFTPIYSFSSANIKNAQNSCTANPISCNSANVGKIRTVCKGYLAKGFEQHTYKDVLKSQCTPSPKINCDKANVGKSYVTCSQ